MESVKIKKDPGKSNDNSQEEHIKNRAMSFHQRILNTIPDVNVKFAAHKATEYAIHKSALQLEEYLIAHIAQGGSKGSLWTSDYDVQWTSFCSSDDRPRWYPNSVHKTSIRHPN